MPSIRYSEKLAAFARACVVEEVSKTKAKTDIVDAMNRARRSGVKPGDPIDVDGDPGVVTPSDLQLDEWGSIILPGYEKVGRVFAPCVLPLVTTNQQRANILTQCSVDLNGNDVPGGAGIFGWEAGLKANAMGWPLQRDGGDNGVGGTIWTEADGHEEIGADGKPHRAWLFVRIRTKARTFKELEKILGDLPAMREP